MPTSRISLRRALVVPLLVGLFLVSATAAVAAPATQFPSGAYVATITPEQLPPGAPPDLVGDWVIEFSADGTYSVTKDGLELLVGRYTANPARIVMTDLGGPAACLDQPGIATAVYAWELEGDQLTLTPVRDACDGRHFVLTAGPLTRQ